MLGTECCLIEYIPYYPFIDIDLKIGDTLRLLIRDKVWHAKHCILDIEEIGENRVFQKTGSIKWRFFQWGIIGGSVVKMSLSDEWFFDFLKLMATPVDKKYEKNYSYNILFRAKAVYPLTTPFSVTILLFLVSVILLLLGRKNSAQKES